ncbi:MAG TPA: hypothetical protein VFA92_16125 [Candidatus Binatia bacterium]|nr:hypothetical protein [Candidatus Binatia bacterium]
MVRYGHMLEADLRSIEVRLRASWHSQGSVLAGTIESACTGVEVQLDVGSDESPALIAALIQNAKGGCYAEAALTQPVPVDARATLNGEELDVTSYPKRPPRRT